MREVAQQENATRDGKCINSKATRDIRRHQSQMHALSSRSRTAVPSDILGTFGYGDAVHRGSSHSTVINSDRNGTRGVLPYLHT